MKAELIEEPVERVSWEEVVKAIREMKMEKAAEPSEVSAEMFCFDLYVRSKTIWCGKTKNMAFYIVKRTKSKESTDHHISLCN